MITVDARGLYCPQPVVNTKKALDELERGEITVIVDSTESCENVRRFAQNQGCEVKVSEGEGCFYLAIVKEEGAEEELKERGDIVLIIGGEHLGTGDKEAGETLMKIFITTLKDVDPKPAKLILLNSAVRLAIEGSEVVEGLQSLERDGVEVQSCGACLDFYNVVDKLRVGLATNMYDVVNSMMSAAKVITI